MVTVRAYLGELGQLSVNACLPLLDDSEKRRAANFSDRRARNEFMRTRALLRLLLSRHTGLRADVLRFDTGPCGKPMLHNISGTHFNVAHSGGMALIAIASDVIGVDIERIDRDVDCAGVAETVFSSKEIEQLHSTVAEGQREVFFATWTRKEAYLKATGQGFSSDLPAISTCSLHEPIKDVSARGGNLAWHAFELPAPPTFKAALVVPSRHCTIEVADITDHAQQLLVPNTAAAA